MRRSPRHPLHGALALALALTGCFSPAGAPGPADTGTTGVSTTGVSTTGVSTTGESTTGEPTDASPTATTATASTADAGSSDTTTAVDPVGSTSLATSEPTTGTTDTTDTTGPAAPTCGDGVTDKGEACDDGAANGEDKPCTPVCTVAACGDGYRCPGCMQMEECDDGNPIDSDGCSAQCRVEGHVMFVSPVGVTFAGDMSVGLADQTCKSLAAPNFQPSRNFVAWLSTDDLPVANRIGSTLDTYRLPRGHLVAEGTKALLEGTILHAVDQDPQGVTLVGAPACEPAGMAWTGTKFNGATDLDHCQGWSTMNAKGLAGNFKSTGGMWTNICPVSCSQQLHIYCIQIG